MARKETPKAETAILFSEGTTVVRVVTGLIDDAHGEVLANALNARGSALRRGPDGPATAKVVGASEPIITGYVETLDQILNLRPDLADAISIDSELERRRLEEIERQKNAEAEAARRAAQERADAIERRVQDLRDAELLADLKRLEQEAADEVDKELKEGE